MKKTLGNRYEYDSAKMAYAISAAEENIEEYLKSSFKNWLILFYFKSTYSSFIQAFYVFREEPSPNT